MKEHVKLFKQKLNKARNLSLKVKNAEREIFEFIDDIGVDYDKSITKNSRVTIGDVITTYVAYGDIERMDELIKLLEALK